VIGIDQWRRGAPSGARILPRARCLFGALIVAGLGVASHAAPLTLEGITFSDELGGVEIKDGWGTGTIDDPFVLVEDITERGPAILVVRGMTPVFGNRIRSHHEVGFALTKIVRNGTGQIWTQFDLELREFIDYPSPFGDGLSFGQASKAGRPFTADGFADNIETREPYDNVAFIDGGIAPGETVVITVVVTDTTPQVEFFLLQKRDAPLAAIPAGAGRDEDRPVVTGRRWSMGAVGPDRFGSEVAVAERSSADPTVAPSAQ
jgi:hypothetical protein